MFSKYVSNKDSNEAKGLAIFEALWSSLFHERLIVESDSSNATSWMNPLAMETDSSNAISRMNPLAIESDSTNAISEIGEITSWNAPISNQTTK